MMVADFDKDDPFVLTLMVVYYLRTPGGLSVGWLKLPPALSYDSGAIAAQPNRRLRFGIPACRPQLTERPQSP
jgi:hypothetical protein